jgi:hypothetical protein
MDSSSSYGEEWEDYKLTYGDSKNANDPANSEEYDEWTEPEPEDISAANLVLDIGSSSNLNKKVFIFEGGRDGKFKPLNIFIKEWWYDGKMGPNCQLCNNVI